MNCSHCKKEQETITIAGKTYCANCSTILAENAVSDSEIPKHKIPKIEFTENEIRTEVPPANKNVETKELRELSKETKLPKVTKDDLEGSAILLDILSDDAKTKANDATTEQNKKLGKVGQEVIDMLTKQEPKKHNETAPQTKSASNGSMRDITTANIRKRNDFIHKNPRQVVRETKRNIENDIKNVGQVISSEKGYTKEYDIMILSIALTAIALIILAIFMTFK